MIRGLPAGLMLVSGLSVYLGASLAIGLFAVASPALMAWLRVATAAVMLVVWFRPHPRVFFGVHGATCFLFGVSTLAMNVTFYEAIARIPLGTAVAIEFFGPVVVAAWKATTLGQRIAPVIAFIGVAIVSGASWSRSPVGVGLAILTAGLWALYVILGSRVQQAGRREGLPVSLAWAALLFLPAAVYLWPQDWSGVAQVYPHIPLAPLAVFLGVSFALGFLSALVPYSLDQVIIRLAGARAFSLLLALLPVSATIVEILFLDHTASAWEYAGVGLVVVAVALGSDYRRRKAAP